MTAIGKAILTLLLSSASLRAAPFLIGSVYDCGKCHKWHSAASASAWALTEDGLMVTNHHVFEKAKGEATGVCGRDGKTHRIAEIPAADPENDIAIFRVDAKGLKPLGLGGTLPVGGDIEVVSDPDGNYFTHTYGWGASGRCAPDGDQGLHPGVRHRCNAA